MADELREPQHKDSWGEVIFYTGGTAWGISPTGATVSLGREDKVKEALCNPQSRCGNPIVDAIIELERKIKGELENGRSQGYNAKRSTSKPVRQNYQRIRFGRPAGVKHLNVRQPKATKKAAIYRS